MDTKTTQQQSYQPVCVPPKEFLPWKQHAKFRMPDIPMENDTTQKLSFMPPGRYVEVDATDCPCVYDGQCHELQPKFLKASDYN